MVSLSALWLPVVLSAVIVFVASFLLHMVIPFHRKDVRKLPDEETVVAALRAAAVPPGQYVFPCPDDPKEMGSPAMQEKYRQGPVGRLAVLPPGPPMMPKNLVQWFAYSVVVGVFAAYLTGRAFGPATEYLTVFRFAGTISFLAYASTHAIDPVWKGGSWAVAARHAFDGLLYGLLTAGVFAWLWP